MFVITKISFSNQLLYLRNAREDMCIPFFFFQEMFYVAFCITIHKSQGQTFDFPYTIHEWDKLDAKLRYTALSRATCREHQVKDKFPKVKNSQPQHLSE